MGSTTEGLRTMFSKEEVEQKVQAALKALQADLALAARCMPPNRVAPEDEAAWREWKKKYGREE